MQFYAFPDVKIFYAEIALGNYNRDSNHMFFI